jgi:hypothetical protein
MPNDSPTASLTAHNLPNGEPGMIEASEAGAQIAALPHDLRLGIDSLARLLEFAPIGILIMRDKSQSDEIIVNRYGAGLLGESASRQEEGPAQWQGRFDLSVTNANCPSTNNLYSSRHSLARRCHRSKDNLSAPTAAGWT